ncbi:TetR/AcrR family transcriptional regulator [Ureibacillus endophyticus]|uniref:TetR/AcrR family transcriptional regulator n=1 Tax=Ureibacillus endophyticus TaxID=1978490 RepID=A0A494YS04_9BACL|nr:TetR/AcrR family transcriptional regulator [Lysinibacillus endophyticus]RKQ12373.1 TetR/AcrR family transcriptional regulator [Lysinibacillus endophyticus]
MSSLTSIKDAAITLFSQKGYEATTLNEIATKVGIKKPSLYVYFSSKQELFLTIFEELLEEYKMRMEQIIEEVDSAFEEEKLFILFEKYVFAFADEPVKSLFWNRVFLFPPLDLKEEILGKISKVESTFIEKESTLIKDLIVQNIIRDISDESALLAFRSLREGLLMTYLINPHLERNKIKEIWKTYWHGLKKGE